MIDRHDILIALGLGIAAYGLWMFKPWLSYCVVGLVFVVLGILSDIYARKPDGNGKTNRG